MSRLASAARVARHAVIVYGSGLAVARITGDSLWGIAARGAAMLAVFGIITVLTARRKKSGRHREAAAAGNKGAVPGPGAGAGGSPGCSSGGRAGAGARVNWCPPGCMCPMCMPCPCPMCYGAAQVAAQAGGGPVAGQFLGNVAATWRSCRPPPCSYNELAAMRQDRYQLVHSDELPGYDGIPADFAAAMDYLVRWYAEVTGRARAAILARDMAREQEMARQAALYSESVRLRLITGPPPGWLAPGGPVVPGSGYTSGGNPAGQVSQGLMQVLPPSPGGYPAPWQAPSPVSHIKAGPEPPPGITPGIAGFQGKGSLALPGPEPGAEVPDSFEPVRGYRWWTMHPAPTDKAPVNADAIWPVAPLRGARDAWAPGENIARCLAGTTADSVHPASEIPLEPCGCGHWAYWQLQHYDISSVAYPVCGVVEGYGQVIIGEKGFRSSKTRIIALALPFTLIPSSAVRRMRDTAWSRAGFRGGVRYPGMPDPGLDVHCESYGNFRAAGEQERRDRADAEAWMGIISDRLSVMYPGVRVYETVAAMMAAFPPDLSYGPPAQPCPYCGTQASDLHAHIVSACGTRGFILE